MLPTSTADVPSISRDIVDDGELARRCSIFDPDHPFAFRPPAYDSLAKEPPKYDELILTTANLAGNCCGVGDSGIAASAAFDPDVRQPSADAVGGQDGDDRVQRHSTVITVDRFDGRRSIRETREAQSWIVPPATHLRHEDAPPPSYASVAIDVTNAGRTVITPVDERSSISDTQI